MPTEFTFILSLVRYGCFVMTPGSYILTPLSNIFNVTNGHDHDVLLKRKRVVLVPEANQSASENKPDESSNVGHTSGSKSQPDHGVRVDLHIQSHLTEQMVHHTNPSRKLSL